MPSPWNCADPAQQLKEMFVDLVQARRIKLGQSPAMRPVFLRLHGVAHGRFEIVPDLPDDLKVGVFKGESYDTWVRFSSDTPSGPDLMTTIGIGIKLFGVDGEKLLGEGDTQDFILQNFDVFFVNNAKDMCEFTRAGVVNGDYKPYLLTHPKTDLLLKEMKKVEASVLSTTYWSGLPYGFGEGRMVKYKLVPEQQADTIPPNPTEQPIYLGPDLQRRLLAGEARFRFMVQFHKPGMPDAEHATQRWSEKTSAPIHVATLILPQQDIQTRGQLSYGENLAYNPWHSLAEHEPKGSLSAARKVVYQASAEQRRNVNGVPVREPGEPRPADPIASDADTRIVKAAIYPPIGVARVGNSKDGYFLAPEVTDPLPEEPGFYRDAKGALKRQAARFRIYGLNAAGVAVRELTADEATIEWQVHVVNQKSAWYQFQLALDIPEAADAPPTLLRNATVSDRSALIIDPDPRSISGKNAKGAKYAFSSGKFMGKTVYLGELRTDEAGRLIFLGGRGVAASYDDTKAVTFANNEAWHDDTSDGPVTAKVTYKGEKLNVLPAWVIVAPPNYGPMQKSVRTMWDLMRDLAINMGTLPKPVRPSFERDIRPLFERMSRLQWVNAGFAGAFGWKKPQDFSQPEWLERLSQSGNTNREMRRTIANMFRVFDRDSYSPAPWPWLYGDAMNNPPAPTPRQFTALTNTQLNFLKQWANGDFDSDYDPTPNPPRRIEDVPIAGQPDMLTKASLEDCLADAFHPGCEMTWPVRSKMMYMAPFRFLHAEKGWKEPQYAPTIDAALSLPNGPLAAQVPGGITRWMAVPWQTDTASCRSGYTANYDPYVPSFWPARVPNQVLTEENYRKVMDEELPLGERLAAFATRAYWTRLLTGTYTEQINTMIAHFGRMGVVEVREGPSDRVNFPATLEVEQLAPERPPLMLTLRAGAAPAGATNAEEVEAQIDLGDIEKVNRFPHGLSQRR
ncbi:MAG TPA: LodA/GoxA family CTQ-dependent oxidase [Thermoanaerobaculia bacterium]